MASDSKSHVFNGGISQKMGDSLCGTHHTVRGQLPIRYLGVSLSASRLTIQQFQPLMKKITSRASFWSFSFLSCAGRLQLIKAILASIQTYWSQIFLISSGVIEEIEVILGAFLWSGVALNKHRALVDWSQVCAPVCKGGLGIRNMKVMNLALLFK